MNFRSMTLTHRKMLAAAIVAILLPLHPAAATSVEEPEMTVEQGTEAYQGGDYETALTIWRTLADRGDAEAQYNLGLMYNNGRGVEQDYSQAAEWFRKAAEQGFLQTQFMLANMYAKGRGVAQDDAQAAIWFRKAAEQGNTTAQYTIGTMYAEGRGVQQDKVQALVWLDLAVAGMSPGGGRDRALKAREAVAEEMTPDELAEADKLARVRVGIRPEND